jgi:tetratricopeptide (TPR) repeat protein
MLSLALLKRMLVAAGLAVGMVVGTAAAKPPADTTFYKAYFLEHEGGDMATAAQLYGEAIEGGLDSALGATARTRLAACREELACADFATLMPPDAFVYLEINRPGEQFGDLLNMLGLVASGETTAKTGEAAETPGSAGAGKHVAISPVLIKEFMGVRGLAAAVTGFDPMTQTPSGVAVFHPGSVDAIRGLLETALPAAAEAVKPIEGYATYQIEGKVFICLTPRLVVVSPQRPQIVALLQRLNGKLEKSLANSEALGEVLRTRGNAALFFCVNAKPIMPMVTAFAGASRELAMANALVDLNSLKAITGRAGVGEHGIYFDLGVGLERGQHNLVYNLMRTPPITRETLACIPKGAAGFMAAALGDPAKRGQAAGTAAGGATPAITGLDFGREVFANIVDFAIYAMPPAEGAESTGMVPDVAAVIRVNDPAKSQALWTQILGIASMAAGAATTDGKVEPIGKAEMRTYQFPNGVSVYFATSGDKIVVGATRQVMQGAVATVSGGDSILKDEAFAPSLARITEHTSKALFVHPGRCFQVARRFMSPNDIKEAEPVVAMLTNLVTSVLTDESEELFHLSATATGLPNVGGLVAQLLQREDQQKQMQHAVQSAKRAGDWDQALAAVDALIAAEPEKSGHLRARFDLLATGKKDHDAAVAYGKTYLERLGQNAEGLNAFAWNLLTEKRYAGQYNELALQAAEQAVKLTQRRNPMILDTLARAKFELGDIKQALEIQRQAVALPGGDHADLRKALTRYEEAEKQAGQARSD